MKHHEIKAHDVTLHVVEESESSENPSVLLCHGFPAIWSSWKFQMVTMARAGYRVIAPDMRGYGRSSAPVDPDVYTPFHTVGDLVTILDALEIETTTVVGHDFGANVAWNAAMMRRIASPQSAASAFLIWHPEETISWTSCVRLARTSFTCSHR